VIDKEKKFEEKIDKVELEKANLMKQITDNMSKGFEDQKKLMEKDSELMRHNQEVEHSYSAKLE
jgi:rubrerythrin